MAKDFLCDVNLTGALLLDGSSGAGSDKIAARLESTGKTAWLTIGGDLKISGGTLNTNIDPVVAGMIF